MSKARGQPSGGLGLEDELSFGSDEDLIADVGEISLPITDSPSLGGPSSNSHVSNSNNNGSNSSSSSKPEKSSGGLFRSKKDKIPNNTNNELKGEKEKRKRTTTEETVKSITSTNKPHNKILQQPSLAKSSLIIDPALESVLDVSSLTNPTINKRNSFATSSSSSLLSSHKSPPSSFKTTTSSKLDLISLSSSNNGNIGGVEKKKKGFMSSFRGLGSNNKKKEDPFSVFGIQSNGSSPIKNRHDLASLNSRDSYTSRSDLSRQQSSDVTSSTLSSPRTDSFDHSIRNKHTLAPISMSPFQAHPPDLTPDSATRSSISASSKRPSISSFARRASTMTTTSFAPSELPGEESPALSQDMLYKFPAVDLPPNPQSRKNSETNSDQLLRPALTTRSTNSSMNIPPSPNLSSDIVSVLIPTFPATLSSLSSIQILQATVIRKTFAIGNNGGMPDKDKSNSIRSLTSVLSSGNQSNSGYNQISKKPIWVTQQLVLTSFKVGGTTPQSTPNPNEYLSKSNPSRTIAHLHLFSVPGLSSASSSSNNKSPSKGSSIGLGIGSSQTFGRRPSLSQNAMNEEIELERKIISRDSTAGVWTEDENGRKFVMRIGFGQSRSAESETEWIIEMRNAEQQQEWIRQIKSIATVIRAEREGHGQAIRNAYSDAVRGDELAMELDLQRNSAPSSQAPSRPESMAVPDIMASGSRNSMLFNIPHQEVMMSRDPSAARAESPEMLPPTPLIGDFNNLNIDNNGISRSKSLSRGRINSISSPFDTQDSTPNSTPSSSRNGSLVPGSAGTLSRIGGSLHRHDKQGSFSSSSSGTSSNNLAKRYAAGIPPPPPIAPPPSVPLPALPGEMVTNEIQSQGRLSLPLPEDDNISQIRQSARAVSLPTSTLSPNQPASKIRKNNLKDAFKPIPLVPEMETSPKIGISDTISSRTSSPLTIDSSSITSPKPQMVLPPTPPLRKSTLTPTVYTTDIESPTVRSELGNEFYTPTETPTSTFSSTIPPQSLSQSTEGGDTIDSSIISTPRITMNESSNPYENHLSPTFDNTYSDKRPENTRYASSINSFTPSIESRSTTTSSNGRRRREKKIAVDIMSEFNESPDAAFEVEGEEEIKEDRPRAIRFA
ncbi:uncharacterized protein L201_002507 [Kwoniella dendrophila CBS 6074]|uniref:PH domain-containing protein n=1 Tax=Kwoniella dendrophila CBS 6074 TaxID=1295534 RepID=A0AAX4JQH5_9TREE